MHHTDELSWDWECTKALDTSSPDFIHTEIYKMYTFSTAPFPTVQAKYIYLPTAVHVPNFSNNSDSQIVKT